MTVSSGTLSFTYDHNGLRTSKTAGSTVTKYIYHGDKLVHVTVGSTPLHIYYDAQGRPAILNYNGTVYIYITNMQGDVLGLRNTSGTEVVRYNYDPWGYLLGTTGSLATTVGKNQPLRYRGYVYDEETGLYYLQSRYYNPEWGRFISADSVINGNLFAYCGNNPINRIDESGHLGWELLLTIK
jgi:RHS repeat-associated protein